MKSISKAGIELIKAHEGLRLKAYRCPANVLTIGYGHTGEDVYEGKIITELEAENLLVADIVKFSRGVRNFVRSSINQNQFDSLVSFAYNVGLGNFRSSTLLKKVNKNPNDPSIDFEFKKWVWAKGKKLPGLIKRREEESNLYFK